MILDMFRLDGKVAVITGGSRGLGLVFAEALAQAGADLVSVQNEEDVSELKSRVEGAGKKVITLLEDLRDDSSAQRTLQTALDHFGHVDILVNNAGIQRRHPPEDFPIEEFDEVLAINLRAVWVYSQTIGRQMLKQGYGKIINIASMQSFQGGITIPAYAAAKHGVAGLTKALCSDWAKKGININGIAPGYMDTAMTAALRADPVRSKQILDRIPAGRWGLPTDLAGACVYLASPASDYVNGQLIVVDGGWMVR
jgi:2-deoxy-D-gluconate 3-dehydrogenase